MKMLINLSTVNALQYVLLSRTFLCKQGGSSASMCESVYRLSNFILRIDLPSSNKQKNTEVTRRHHSSPNTIDDRRTKQERCAQHLTPTSI